MRQGITLVDGDEHATQWVATASYSAESDPKDACPESHHFPQSCRTGETICGRCPTRYCTVPLGLYGWLRLRRRPCGRAEGGARWVQHRPETTGRKRGILTEGVDLPAVDMVVFTNPRRSRVDIIQAVGRAMRKPRGGNKTLGYVVVPSCSSPHKAHDLQAACEQTDWEDIVDVLAALREHDTRLDELIRQQQTAKGAGEPFNLRTFKERVQVLGPLVSLDLLQKHIGSVVLDRLGMFWDERYGELLAFKNHHGHCRVPKTYPAAPLLERWLGRQRSFYRRGILRPDRLRLLEALGVTWEPQDHRGTRCFTSC